MEEINCKRCGVSSEKLFSRYVFKQYEWDELCQDCKLTHWKWRSHYTNEIRKS